MHWGGFSGSGVDTLIKVEGTWNQNGCIDLLRDQFLPLLTENLAPEWVFPTGQCPMSQNQKNFAMV